MGRPEQLLAQVHKFQSELLTHLHAAVGNVTWWISRLCAGSIYWSTMPQVTATGYRKTPNGIKTRVARQMTSSQCFIFILSSLKTLQHTYTHPRIISSTTRCLSKMLHSITLKLLITESAFITSIVIQWCPLLLLLCLLLGHADIKRQLVSKFLHVWWQSFKKLTTAVQRDVTKHSKKNNAVMWCARIPLDCLE